MQVEVERAAASVAVMPWGMWTSGMLALEPPPGWTVVSLAMADAHPLGEHAIAAALDHPVDAEPLQSLATGKRTVAIAVDDITRPTPAGLLLGPIVRRLMDAGIPERNITIVIATGAHRAASPQDVERKLGTALAARLSVVAHDCERDLVDTGVQLAGMPVRINRAFASADLRIGVGAVMPHPFAAFSGGGKIVIPGVADLDVLARTHKFALMGLHGGQDIEKNRFRAAMEAAVRAIGLHWSVNVVVNSSAAVGAVHAGDFVSAHRLAASAAARIGRTGVPETALDALVVNAFPKDGELIQAEAAFVALRGGLMERLRREAPIVLAARCHEGVGTHRLLGPGGRFFRPGRSRAVLEGRHLIVFAPGVEERDVRRLYDSSCSVATSWEEVRDLLPRLAGAAGRMGLLPCAPLQVVGGEVQ